MSQGPPHGGPFACGEVPIATPTLITEDMAAYTTGRPGSTIRRWASEGRITRHGHGRGQVRYDLHELPVATRDEYTGEILHRADPPPLPQRAPGAAQTAV